MTTWFRNTFVRDTITRRFALAIAVAAAVAVGLNALFVLLGGTLARPGPDELGLPDQVALITRILDAAPPSLRPTLAQSAHQSVHANARVATSQVFVTTWHTGTPPFAPALAITNDGESRAEAVIRAALGTWPGDILFIRSGDLRAHTGPTAALVQDHPSASFLQIRLHDGTWLLFTAPDRVWGPPPLIRATLRFLMFLVSIAVVATLGACRLAGPINAFANAARRFGTDPKGIPMATPMLPQGPAEFRAAIVAFNAMQSRVQRFLNSQAAVFAAISHDLRTPLTRIRLRGEYIHDKRQQQRLFQDVDEMQAMVAAALAYLRDNESDEATTQLDLAELLQTIADDFADVGTPVAYTGPAHLAYPGRPIGLRRAVTNLVDNAARYATRPSITLATTPTDAIVTVSDEGPGIPDHALEDVFAPFHRLDTSRNRNTGGVGLGLTAVRSSVQAHGGEITLSNRPQGGMQATIKLPIP